MRHTVSLPRRAAAFLLACLLLRRWLHTRGAERFMDLS